MDEIMEGGPFNRKGKQHMPFKWGKLSKLEVDPQVVGEMFTKGEADHNLRLFDEFCDLLDRDELTIVEITRITKHDALEFYNNLVHSCVKMNKKNKVAEIVGHMAKHKVPRNIGFCE